MKKQKRFHGGLKILFLTVLAVLLLAGCGLVAGLFFEGTVTFMVEDSVYETQKAEGYALVPEAPERTGYTFTGWYTDKEQTELWDFYNDIVSEDMKLYAGWKENIDTAYTVEYWLQNVDDDDYTLTDTKHLHGETGETVTAKLLSYTGFSENEEHGERAASGDILADGSLVLKRYYDRNLYGIIFEENGGSEVISGRPRKYNSLLPKPDDPTKTGYGFAGWYKEVQLVHAWDFTSDRVTEDISLYAKWSTDYYTIEYTMNDGVNHEDNPAAYTVGDSVTLKEPSRTGFTFTGWYDGSSVNKVVTIPAGTHEDKEYTAVWTAIDYTITYHLDGGINDGDNPESCKITDFTINLKDPSKTGYTFAGWYGNEELSESSPTIPTGSYGERDFFAKWEAIDYTIIYHLDGGTEETNPNSFTLADDTIVLAEPEKTGYTFAGWYSDEELTTASAVIASGTHEHKEFWASWIKDTYAITYHLFGGENGIGNPATYQVTDSLITLADPSRPHYAFGGWYRDAGFTNVSATIASGSTGDKDFYAKWGDGAYIFYDANGADSGTAPEDQFKESSTASIQLAANSGNLAKTGYTLETSWNTAADGSGSDYAFNSSYTGSSNLMLYANWSPISSTVSLDAGDGSGGTTSLTAVYDEAMPAEKTAPALTGYTFGGYYSEENGNGTKYYDESMVSTATWNKVTDTTLYAKWSANTYTVTLDPDSENAIGGTASVEATYETGMPSASAPTRTGYSFGGYWTGQGGTGTQYYDDEMTSLQDWDQTEDDTLYAEWSVNEYTVTFDTQTGTGGSVSVQATYDAAMPAATAPEKTGYTFLGYFDAADETGVVYYDNSMASARSWDKGEDTTLYARWSAEVTYDSQSATTGSDPASKTVYWTNGTDTVEGLPAAPVKTGYTFAGWWTAVSGGGTEFKADTEVTGDITVYAKWTATVTYDSQSATTGSDPASRAVVWTSGTDSVESLPTAPEKTGYTFGGWFTEAGGSGTEFTATTEVTAHITVYAKWTAQVSCNYGYKTGDDDKTEVEFTNREIVWTSGTDTVGTLPSAPSAPAGYTFAGWYTALSGGGTEFKADTEVTGDIDVYAKWTTTVTYDSQSATTEADPTSSTVILTTGVDTVTLPAAPEKTGYSFGGWFTDNTSFTTEFTADTEVTGTITVYANWTANTYTITLDPDGGTVGTASVEATFNSAMPAIATAPTKTDYTFGGFYSAINGGGTQYYKADTSSATNWDIAEETPTLYAKWNATVTYDKNEGDTDAAPASEVVVLTDEADTVQALPTTEPTRANYQFSGWNTKADGTGTAFTATTEVTQNITVYAVWNQEYTVTLNDNGGAGGSGTVTAAYGEAMPTASKPTRSGYTFNGYYTATSGGTQYYTSSMGSARNWDQLADDTLYAQWTANTYYISYNTSANNVVGDIGAPTPSTQSKTGTNSINLQTWDDDASWALTDSNMSDNIYYNGNTAYRFLGWSTSSDNTVDYSGGASYNAAASDTLYACWDRVDVGDQGPGGGVVAYDAGSRAYGPDRNFRYIEYYYQGSKVIWGNDDNYALLDGSSRASFFGVSNTETAMSRANTNDGGAVRSTWVYSKLFNGVAFTDWGLPSENDMRHVVEYSNAHGNWLGSDDYWTSTGIDHTVLLMNGSTAFFYYDNAYSYNVHKYVAVRYF